MTLWMSDSVVSRSRRLEYRLQAESTDSDPFRLKAVLSTPAALNLHDRLTHLQFGSGSARKHSPPERFRPLVMSRRELQGSFELLRPADLFALQLTGYIGDLSRFIF